MSAAEAYPDPLRLDRPASGLAHVPSYWEATAGPAPEDDGPLAGDAECDIAVIGGGYTGLSCAYQLGRRGAGSVRVLEANRPAWGCSGRNGSFARPAIGRLPHEEWVARWGRDGARALFAEALAALETVRETIAEERIDCDVAPDGFLKLAHRPDRVEGLKREARLLRDTFGFEAEFLDAGRVAEEHVRGGEAHGALRWPVSFAMHPLKLGHGLVRAARARGARVHPDSPVLRLEKDAGGHVLTTPAGRVCAREVVVATNGYTVERSFPRFRGRLMPVLSNIVVTQPLTPGEIEEGNFRTTDCLCDTRKLLHYYRRLPDGRIMLGGKGPLAPGERAMAEHRQALLDVVARKFPFVRAPRADYFWGGWVALTADSMPRIATAEDDPTLHYALGYIGSGVSCSIHAGRRVAERICGAEAPLPEPLTRPLPRYPLAAFRRLGQAAAYRWYRLKDERFGA